MEKEGFGKAGAEILEETEEDGKKVAQDWPGTYVSKIEAALFPVGCANKRPQTGCVNNRRFFLTALDGRSLRPGWLDEGYLLGCRLIASSHGGRGWGVLWSLFYKGINPIGT